MKQIDENLIEGIIKIEILELLKEKHKEKAYFVRDEKKLADKYAKLITNKLKEFIE